MVMRKPFSSSTYISDPHLYYSLESTCYIKSDLKQGYPVNEIDGKNVDSTQSIETEHNTTVQTQRALGEQYYKLM